MSDVMKQFLAFKYDAYYPTGGKGDFAGDFDSIESARTSPATATYLDLLDTATGQWLEFESSLRDPVYRPVGEDGAYRPAVIE